MILVQPTYFSPIIQYAKIVKSKKIVFEFEDNFQKQTYRNRCYISGANGNIEISPERVRNTEVFQVIFVKKNQYDK